MADKNASIGESDGSNGKTPTSLSSKFITKKSNFNISKILCVFLCVSVDVIIDG